LKVVCRVEEGKPAKALTRGERRQLTMTASRATRLLHAGVGAAALVCMGQAPLVSARGVHVNVTAAWPSSPLYPLLETSEFLAEENPLFFWRFVEALSTKQDAIARKAGDVDALAAFAVDTAHAIAPHVKNVRLGGNLYGDVLWRPNVLWRSRCSS
jgi:hypothetical protein